MIDQYGVKVPDDLVDLPDIALLDPMGIEMAFHANWYEIDGIFLCASAKAIDYESEESPETEGAEVCRVDDHLKRYNAADGFYHA